MGALSRETPARAGPPRSGGHWGRWCAARADRGHYRSPERYPLRCVARSQAGSPSRAPTGSDTWVSINSGTSQGTPAPCPERLLREGDAVDVVRVAVPDGVCACRPHAGAAEERDVAMTVMGVEEGRWPVLVVPALVFAIVSIGRGSHRRASWARTPRCAEPLPRRPSDRSQTNLGTCPVIPSPAPPAALPQRGLCASRLAAGVQRRDKRATASTTKTSSRAAVLGTAP